MNGSPSGSCSVRICRETRWLNGRSLYKVVLDGSIVGTVGDGEHIDLEVPSGRHEIQLRLAWCGSNVCDLELTDVPVELMCGCSTGPRSFGSFMLWLLLPVVGPIVSAVVGIRLLLYLTVLRRKFLWIRQTGTDSLLR